VAASFCIPSPRAKTPSEISTTNAFRRRLRYWAGSFPYGSLYSSNFEYEYIPFSPLKDEPSTGFLPSSYPEGAPAGLRGEAVRSALKSGRCIGWNLSSSESSSSNNPLCTGGVLQVQGKGMLDFLNNKLSQTFSAPLSPDQMTYNEACLLTARGHVIDRLRVCIVDSTTALILTSPGHTSQQLLERLDPFVFPLDQVTLTNLNAACSFTLASTQWNHVQMVLVDQARSFSGARVMSSPFPTRLNQCVSWQVPEDDGTTTKAIIMPSIGLPPVAGVGYTIVFCGSTSTGKSGIGTRTWNHLISDDNTEGPIGIGPREYEMLRIEAGQAAYGKEIGVGSDSSSSVDGAEEGEKRKSEMVKTSPLEIHWQADTINMEKGCYLGQEGVASIYKNPRGPPRILYSVVFEDNNNVYESQTRGDRGSLENLTRPAKPGDPLFVLGSNEAISVGRLTSVAESGGTGKDCTVGLILVRRADSIRKQMKELDLEIEHEIPEEPALMDRETISGIVQPPPLDPLDGLEVIVGGTFTVGRLRMVPSRRIRRGRNMFDNELEVVDLQNGGDKASYSLPEVSSRTSSKVAMPPGTTRQESSNPSEMTAEEEYRRAIEEAAKAQEEADAAAAEAKRKAEKMEMLKKRAEEAMARKRQQKNEE
jgi:folate-binding Fe-S cluster repair protein YgfZ